MLSRSEGMRRRAKFSLIALAATSASAGLIESAFAQTGGTWTFNGNDNWSSAAAWIGNQVPDGLDGLAGFGTGVNVLDTLTVTLDTNRTIGALSFSDSDLVNTPAGWRIQATGGSALNLQTSGNVTVITNLSASVTPAIQVVTLGTGDGTSTIGTLFQKIVNLNLPISGNQGFIKTGPGTVALSGNNSGLSGTVTLYGGILVLNNANALGSVSNIDYQSGQIALRGDTGLNFSGTNISLINDSTFGVGNGIGSGGLYGTGSNQTHTLGDITINQYGSWNMGISGSNGYGLTMGRLTVRDGLNFVNQGNAGSINGAGSTNGVNGLGSGLVTIGTITYAGPSAGTVTLGGVGSFAGDITVTNGLTVSGGGSAALVYTGSKTLTLNGAIGTGGDVSVTGATTGTVAAGNFQAGVGTMIVNVGSLPNNRSLTLNGTLILNGGALTHNVVGLAMGGATLTTPSTSIPAYLNAGGGTIAIGSNGITVNDSTLVDVVGTTAGVISGATAGGLLGRLDLGASTRNIAVNGSSTLTLDGVVSGTGGITKTGTGALNFTKANTFTGNIDLRDGVVSGVVQGVGNSFGATPPNVSLGGALRLNGTTSAGTGTVNTLTSKDSGVNEGLIVDATNGGTTTLNINSFGGREVNTHGTIKVTPFTGSLNNLEVVNISTSAPASTNGILPAYFAIQNSNADTKLGFASLSSNKIVNFAGYASGGINAAAITSVYDLAAGSTEALSGAKQLFGLRVGAGASISGAQALSLGNGSAGFGGLILNGGATMGAGSIAGQVADELVVWSGGTSANTISSSVVLGGDLTTGGATPLNLTGALNLGGSTRNISVTGATVTLSGNNALTNGNFVKRGGGVMVVSANNPLFAGTIGIEGGTLQMGASPAGDLGSGNITNNANLSINRSDAPTISNNISGSGDLWVNGTSAGVLTLGGALSYTGRTTVQTGTLKINANDRLPTGTPLRVEGGSTFDMNGFTQVLGGISGAGTIINNNSGSAFRTLTVNGPGTFTGSIRNGTTGSISLTKNGAGTLILGVANTMTGTLTINGGTLQANAAAALGSGTVVMSNGAALALNYGNQTATSAAMIFSGNTTISVTGNPVVKIFGGNVAGSNFVYDGSGPSLFTGAGYTWTGGGTINLVVNGRNLHIGPGGFTAASNPNFMQTFSGTLKFDDNNGPGTRIRFSSGNEQYTTGSSLATFDFGNGVNVMNTRNGTVQFNIGWIQGGTNSIIEGCENGTGRTDNFVFGAINGDQTFYGTIRDYVTPELNGIVGFTKNNVSSTLTLKSTLGFTGGITMNAGTVFFGSGAKLTNAATIIMNGGTISILPGATITSNRLFAISNAGVGGGINVASFPGFSTPSGVNFVGGGTIYGNIIHNAGSFNPGIVGGFGTLTVANNLQLAGGAMDFDVSATSPNVIGAGVQDLLKVSASSGLDLTSGTLRLNFFNAANDPAGNTPPPTLAVGQFFPIISYTGTYTGSRANMFTTAKFRGSFTLEEGTGTLANTLGAKVQAIGGPLRSLVWTPIGPQTNIWDAAVGFQNWKPLGGAGSLFFFNGDSVTFDDTTSIRTVNITPGLAPTAMTVNTNGVYVLTGQGFGSIIGSTSIVKNGTGTLFLTGDNAYVGGTTVNAGTIVVGDPNTATTFPLALGGPNATTTFNGDSNYRFISALNNTFSGPGNTFTSGGNFVFNPGNHKVIGPGGSIFPYPFNINFFGTGSVTFERPTQAGGIPTMDLVPGTFASFAGTIKISDTVNTGGDGTIFRAPGGGNPSMTLDLGNAANGGGLALLAAGQTFTVGALRGGPNTSFKIVSAANTATTGTFIVGGNTASLNSTFNGVFRAVTAIQGAVLNPLGIATVVKNGSGSTFTMTQNQPYVGATIINAGTLALSNGGANPLVSPTILINSGGVLDVAGLNGGGGMILNGNQRLISNGSVVGGQVEAVNTSTIGGTSFGNPLVADAGSTISPGNSVGTLTVSNLSLNGSVNFLVEVDGSGIDSLVLSGTQTGAIVTAISSLNLVNLGGFVPGTYTFLDYTGNPADQTGIEFGFVPQDFAYGVTVIHDTANTRVLLQFTDTSAQWFTNGNGTWSTASNWTLDGTNPSGVVPNSVRFGTFITAPRTVNVNGTIGNTANSIIFNSPQKYTIAGPGTLTLDSGGAVPLNVQGGSHAITATVRALKNVSMNIDAGLNLSFGGTVINANNSGIIKLGAGSATFTRLNMPGGTLTVNTGTVNMTAKPANNSADGANLLANIAIAGGAKVDLANNAMLLDYGTLGNMLTDLRAELADGRLFSSTAAANQTLGYRNNNTGTTPAGGTTTPGLGLGQTATFAGMAADTTSIIVRVTYKGDSNLDGIVNVLDLYNLSLNWLASNAVWSGGDFNFDGVVNSADLGLLAQNWQQGNNNPLPGDDINAALTAAGIPLSAVPEPSTVALTAAAALGLLGRRRRRGT